MGRRKKVKLTCMTGRAGAVRKGALDFLAAALAAPGEGEALFLVPDQYTLQAEIEVLDGLNLPGSFRLQVLSPRRLFHRIFQAAGGPREALVDEQGRVMLMQAAAQSLAGSLSWYGSALTRPGFAQRCVSQLTAFKQAGLSPEDVANMAGAGEGALSLKLKDLALLYQAYEEALAGRFMDGEDQARRACLRMEGAPFLRGARVCVYGFDLVSPTLAQVILALLPLCQEVALALVLAQNQEARDYSLFWPVERSWTRLEAQAQALGAHTSRIWLPDAPRPGALGHLERELFCVPQTVYEGPTQAVQLALCRNPQEEAEFAAALIRRLCRTRGWRYRDFALVLATQDQALTGALNRAFQLYKVPLFLTQGRSADKHPLSACLLSALRAVTRGWALADLVGYIRSGFSGLTGQEADLLVNYAQAHGLRGRAWLSPLTRGEEAERQAAEPLRQRVIQPLAVLAASAKAAKDLSQVLAAVFGLLEDIDAYQQMEAQAQSLQAQGLTVWAAEGAQVWNRLVQALDQMTQLLPPARMGLSQVYEMLRRALSATVVKALPQSADAVEGGALEHLRGKPVRALLVVGAWSAAAASPEGLLDEEEMALMGDKGVELGLSAEERQRMARLGFKSLLSMTGEYLLISRSQSDASGRALQAGALMNEIAHLLPRVRIRGGVMGDQGMLRVRLEQPGAALCRLPGLLRGGGPLPQAALAALKITPGMEAPLARMRASFAHKVYSEKLDKALARRLMGPGSVSASRLERFAACPFRHFAHYALRPQEFRPFALSPRDAGSFYHQALEAFIRQSGDRLGQITQEEGQAMMDQLTGEMTAQLLQAHGGDSALAKAEGEKLRRVARRAAAVVVRQFDGSLFRPASVELDIQRDQVRVEGRAALGGRIDRVDLWQTQEGEKYLRVIDYKTGGRSVSLQDIYYGLQLQLILYLAAATAQLGGRPAGIFYFTIADPLIATQSRDPEAVELEREHQLRLDGLILGQEDVVRAMAAQPQRAVNVAFNRDGSLRAGDKVLQAQDFSRLMRRAMDQAAQMVREMEDGQTAVAPAQSGSRLACRFCEYATLCGYDPLLEGARPRKLPKLSPRQVLEALREDYPQSGE